MASITDRQSKVSLKRVDKLFRQEMVNKIIVNRLNKKLLLKKKKKRKTLMWVSIQRKQTSPRNNFWKVKKMKKRLKCKKFKNLDYIKLFQKKILWGKGKAVARNLIHPITTLKGHYILLQILIEAKGPSIKVILICNQKWAKLPARALRLKIK